ncbi:hypothetical protein [Beijerinckia indica]|uniref:hypothetical protein n=1 Tax=Beijerinckia indica TaxID=533 RepID=UPI0002FD4966|nr:hypothetical protein [Beijerinckia indica]
MIEFAYPRSDFGSRYASKLKTAQGSNGRKLIKVRLEQNEKNKAGSTILHREAVFLKRVLLARF